MAIPNQVGRYRITGELGRGAMGAVYRAHDPQLDRPVAIKMISAAAGGGSLPAAEAEARFLREARVAARLVHPHIVAVFDAGRAGDDLYLVMELVDGESLAARLGRGRWPTQAEALEIVAQTAEALAVAHAAGVIHRDIKPANILIAADGRVKVSDFGVAKAIGESTELTRTGMLVGSPAYMAPEQIKGLELDGRADLFSLGVVLYELLLRRKPFPADTVTTLVYQILHEDPLADPAISVALPGEQSALLRACLAKEAAARIPDGKTLAARCRALVGSSAGSSSRFEPPTRVMVAPALSPTPPSPPPPPPPPAAVPPPVRPTVPAVPAVAVAPAPAAMGSGAPPPRRGGLGWLWLAGAAVLAVGFGLAVLLLRSPQAPPGSVPAAPVANLPAPVDEPPAPVGTPFGAADLPATPTPTPVATVEPTPLPTFYAPPPKPTVAPTPLPTREPTPEPAPTATPEPTPTRPPITETYYCRSRAEFHVDPEDARVVIDGRDIGTADEWDDAGGGKQWRIDREGRHLVGFSLPGYLPAWVELLVDPGVPDEVCEVELDLEKIRRR